MFIDILSYCRHSYSKPNEYVCDRFSTCQRPDVAGKWFYIISVTDKYMSSQVRAGRFQGVENRGVADMSRSGESLRFVDQQK